MNKALAKAIEGGYLGLEIKNVQVHGEPIDDSKMLLNPFFWRCLGKAMGWGIGAADGKVIAIGRDGYINAWQSYWHDFIDHLAEGKDANSFFEELLNNK